MVCDTPSHGSDHLCLIWKESTHNCRCYSADTACGTDGRTDRRTDRRSETSIPPQQLRCAGGIIINKTRPFHTQNSSILVTIFQWNYAWKPTWPWQVRLCWWAKMRELTNLRSAPVFRNFLPLIQARISNMLPQSVIKVFQNINFIVYHSSSKCLGT